MTNLNHSSQKQSYHLPQFRAYGNISSLTKAAGLLGANCDKPPGGGAAGACGTTTGSANKTS